MSTLVDFCGGGLVHVGKEMTSFQYASERGEGEICSSELSVRLSVDPLYLICCHYCSVTKSCPTLCDPVDGSMPGSAVLPYLPESAQIHVHWVGDAIQPYHPPLPPSPFAFNLSQHQGLFLIFNMLPANNQSKSLHQFLSLANKINLEFSFSDWHWRKQIFCSGQELPLAHLWPADVSFLVANPLIWSFKLLAWVAHEGTPLKDRIL